MLTTQDEDAEAVSEVRERSELVDDNDNVLGLDDDSYHQHCQWCRYSHQPGYITLHNSHILTIYHEVCDSFLPEQKSTKKCLCLTI